MFLTKLHWRSLLLALTMSQETMATCSKDTSGTCQTDGCDANRMANCIDKKCMCADGFCAENGVCEYKTECSAHVRCNAKSLEGNCCPGDNNLTLDCCASEDFTPVVVNTSQCGKDTDANCHILNCKAGRQAVCKDRQCICPDGFCTVPDPADPGGDKLCKRKAECAFHPQCSNLLGDCCPGPNGTDLDCCSPKFDQITSGAEGMTIGITSVLIVGVWATLS